MAALSLTNSLGMPWAIVLIIPANINKPYRKLGMWCHNQIWYVLWWYWKTRGAWRKKNKLHVTRLAFWSYKSSNENKKLCSWHTCIVFVKRSVQWYGRLCHQTPNCSSKAHSSHQKYCLSSLTLHSTEGLKRVCIANLTYVCCIDKTFHCCHLTKYSSLPAHSKYDLFP